MDKFQVIHYLMNIKEKNSLSAEENIALDEAIDFIKFYKSE